VSLLRTWNSGQRSTFLAPCHSHAHPIGIATCGEARPLLRPLVARKQSCPSSWSRLAESRHVGTQKQLMRECAIYHTPLGSHVSGGRPLEPMRGAPGMRSRYGGFSPASRCQVGKVACSDGNVSLLSLVFIVQIDTPAPGCDRAPGSRDESLGSDRIGCLPCVAM
jgi:hypothetical protein